MLRLSGVQARALLVNHLVVGPKLTTGPDPVTAVVDGLGCVQVDPMRVVERNQELVLHARLPSYCVGKLDDALYRRRVLVEVLANVRYIAPASDLPYYRPRFARAAARYRPQAGELEPLMARLRRDLEREGPLSSTDLEDRDKVRGWWDADGRRATRAVRQALEWMWHFGEVMIARRAGLTRYFDLTERLFPDLDDAVTPAQSQEYLAAKYLRAAGLLRASDPQLAFDRLRAPARLALLQAAVQAGQVVEVEIENVSGSYYLHTDLLRTLEAPPATGPDRVALLPPLDNLLRDRRRLRDLFGFDYTWEAYVPAARRRYGPYTMPILHGHELVGRLSARTGRKERLLHLEGSWWEGGRAGGACAAAVDRALHRLAVFTIGCEDAQVHPALGVRS